MARQKGFVPVLTTNGTLLSKRTDMLDALPHKLQISLHSHEGASQMKLEVAALTEETDMNTELSAGEVETVAKMVDTSQTMIQQSLGRTEVVLDIMRTTGGKTESQVAVSYDGNLAKETLLSIFEKEDAQIKQKLQDLLNK